MLQKTITPFPDPWFTIPWFPDFLIPWYMSFSHLLSWQAWQAVHVTQFFSPLSVDGDGRSVTHISLLSNWHKCPSNNGDHLVGRLGGVCYRETPALPLLRLLPLQQRRLGAKLVIALDTRRGSFLVVLFVCLTMIKTIFTAALFGRPCKLINVNFIRPMIILELYGCS